MRARLTVAAVSRAYPTSHAVGLELRYPGNTHKVSVVGRCQAETADLLVMLASLGDFPPELTGKFTALTEEIGAWLDQRTAKRKAARE